MNASSTIIHTFDSPNHLCARLPTHTVNSYLLEDGIVYLTLADKSYHKRLAFLYLEDLKNDFISFLQQEHGDGCVFVARPVSNSRIVSASN